MENPKIKTTVEHSQTKTAWNVIGQNLGGKYKIARIPYLLISDSEMLSTKNKYEALMHAQYISLCFNNSDRILALAF